MVPEGDGTARTDPGADIRASQSPNFRPHCGFRHRDDMRRFGFIFLYRSPAVVGSAARRRRNPWRRTERASRSGSHRTRRTAVPRCTAPMPDVFRRMRACVSRGELLCGVGGGGRGVAFRGGGRPSCGDAGGDAGGSCRAEAVGGLRWVGPTDGPTDGPAELVEQLSAERLC